MNVGKINSVLKMIFMLQTCSEFVLIKFGLYNPNSFSLEKGCLGSVWIL